MFMKFLTVGQVAPVMSHLLHHAVFIHFMLTVLKLNIFLICSSVMQSYAVRERVAVSCLPLRPISVSLLYQCYSCCFKITDRTLRQLKSSRNLTFQQLFIFSIFILVKSWFMRHFDMTPRGRRHQSERGALTMIGHCKQDTQCEKLWDREANLAVLNLMT